MYKNAEGERWCEDILVEQLCQQNTTTNDAKEGFKPEKITKTLSASYSLSLKKFFLLNYLQFTVVAVTPKL